MLTGENSILKQAVDAKERTEYAEIKEMLDLKLIDYIGKNKIGEESTLFDYFNSYKGKDRIDYVTDNGDGTITVVSGKYNFIIEENGVRLDDGVMPQLEEPEIVLSSDKTKSIIKVKVKNASDFDSCKIIIVNKDNNKIEKEVTGEQAEVEVDSNGNYEVKAEGTKDESSRTAVKVAKVTDINVTFSTDYGKIDVIWVDKNNRPIKEPLKAEDNLNGLTPIKLNSDGTYTKNPTTKWYEYKASTGNTDSKQSEWANAINSDDSFFVWIPRYAYRITYFSDENYTKVSGYFDGRGMVDTKGNSVTSANGATITPKETTIIQNGKEKKITASLLDNGVNIVEQNGIKYIVHPAFETDKNLGGWKSDLAGIWIAKYEMSREKYSSGNWTPQGKTSNGGGNTLTTKADNAINSKTDSETIRTVSKPNTTTSTVSSWRNINIGNCYSNSYYYDRTKESHLMKNSEWGAAAYLTHSQYGRNGNEIRINNNNSYFTGSGAKIKDESSSADTNAYNTADGMLASSTGNITGIYDLSGGAWEYIAAFNSVDTNNHFTSYGSSFASMTKTSDEYATQYINSGNYSKNTRFIYTVGKTGDATKEVRTNINSKNWFNDTSKVLGSGAPFFGRGGWCNATTGYAGIFDVGCDSGIYKATGTFRVVLAQ